MIYWSYKKKYILATSETIKIWKSIKSNGDANKWMDVTFSKKAVFWELFF